MSSDPKQKGDRACRRRPSSRLRKLILDSQSGCCLSCEQPLVEVEFDHVIPLGLGGDNGPDNWAAVCPSCHKRKTGADLKRIAKAKRQRRYHETGRSRAKSTFAPIGARSGQGFSKTNRRHMNGVVSRTCSCARCQSKKKK